MHPTRAGRLPVEDYLDGVHRRYLGLRDGAVADYIPPLGAVDPEQFAIAVATTDGQVYGVGDVATAFTLQSISKPFTYGLALEDRGLAEVRSRIGVEPSGDAFNSISLDATGRPRNPMINAGAIAAAGLVAGDDPFARLLASYGRWAGRPLEVDTEVYLAERETGHRNRAIGHMLRAVGSLDGDPERALDVYFQQCSVAVTCSDLAVMAATLAARGVNPLTGEQALTDASVNQVLSVMTTCGMYDAAGEWLVGVGIPAKSGVSGGIIGVLPGQLGIAVFSPRLDAVGNSARGVAVFRQLSKDLRLHFVHTPRTARAAVVGRSLTESPSTRSRPPAERERLDARTDRCLLLETSGDVLFAGAEALSRAALTEPHRYVLVDLSRSTTVDPAAARLLAGLARSLARVGDELVLAGANEVTATAVGVRHFASPDAAREWCEDRLLGPAVSGDATGLQLADHPVCAGLSPDDLSALGALTQPLDLEAGDVLVEAGEPALRVFLLLAGDVEVSTGTSGPARRRLATLSPGTTFGEAALTLGGRHTARVQATSAVRVLALPAPALAQAPLTLRLHLTQAFLVSAHRALARATREVALSR